MKTSIAILGAVAAAASASVIVPRQHGYGYGNPHGGSCSHKPLVDSKKLQDSIKEKALLKGSQTLQDIAYSYPERNRVMGSNGHNDTVKFLVKELEALGGYYTVEKQKFTNLIQTNGTATLTIGGAETEWGMMEYSPSGNVTSSLVVVNNLGCSPSDYPAALPGKIALISRGSCEFGLKSALAGAAGAVGALIYNNIPGGLAGTLGTPPRPEGDYIPTLGISQEKGRELVATLGNGTTVTASLNVRTVIELQTTENVIATSNCGAHNTTLMLGAHTDSVAAGPGINDDGSGTIGILEVAKQLAKYKANNAVRFGFWSGEESGLLGSTYYVEHLSAAERGNIRAYLNFDMIASPNYVHAIYDGDGSAFNLTGPAGSAEIEKFFQDFFTSHGQNFTATEFDGRSDYLGFIDAGIPAGGTFTGAEKLKTTEEAEMFGGHANVALDANYHSAGDTVDNLNATAFVLHTKAIAAAVAEYATSFASLPPRSVERRSVAATVGISRHRRGGRWGRPLRQ
ncbi:Zn-dependent exopeptidase [Westerdykella ornata]|uniref:Peptide hydrolase n=1 Tax=Westerdykella ornata TaxID=318751 RepID=A0A6A6JC27_WESOR|nr:Zn-dependent exopeptidase [Westerdykella ornata]KAF2274170.1 Zn-dependent exopeptidase [Westerdykella ornata]